MKFYLKQFYYILFIPIYFLEIILFKFFKIKNSNLSYYAMVNYFCLSGGWSNNILHNFLKKTPNQIDGNLDLHNLKKNGYEMKKNYLDKNFVTKIKNDLSTLDGYWLGDKYNSRKKEKLSKEIKSTKYYYSAEDLVKLKSIQSFLIDDKLMNVARGYLNAEPILYNINCWYNFPSKTPDTNAAQLWHFDMDRPKWLKVFVYLTDCGKDNGPHCFVRGSHRNNSIPFKFRKLGYSRINDVEIIKEFPEKDILEYKFSEGDMVIEDSRGLHKGKQVITEHRLILQIEYASSLFGGFYNKPTLNKSECDKNFYEVVSSNSYNFQGIKIN